MTDKYKCPNCPYYKQKTSYGTEEVKCHNTDCVHYNANDAPLPKGHGDLIDKSDLLTVTDIRADGSEFTYIPYSEIDNAAIIIEADNAEKRR